MIKLTTRNFINLCEAISDVNIANESLHPMFTLWCKRLKARYDDEIDMWNSLTDQERAIAENEEFVIDLPTLNIKYAPDIYLNKHVEILSIIFHEPLPKRITQIEQLIQSKKDVKTNKKTDTTGN